MPGIAYRPNLGILNLAIIAACACALPTSAPPGAPAPSKRETEVQVLTTAGAVVVDTGQTLGEVDVGGARRFIYKPTAGGNFSYVADPLLSASLDVSLSKQRGQACFRLRTTSFDYKYSLMHGLAMRPTNVFDTRSLTTIQATGLILTLAPKGGTSDDYTSTFTIKRTLQNVEEGVCFPYPPDVLGGTGEWDVTKLTDWLNGRELDATYSAVLADTAKAYCELKVIVTDETKMLHDIFGPAGGANPRDEIFVTRRELASALQRQLLRIDQACTGYPEAEQQLKQAHKSAEDWLPIIQAKLDFHDKRWSDLAGKLSSLSFPGEDAHSHLTSWLDETSRKLAASDTLDLSGSAEAEYLELFKGKASGRYFKDHKDSDDSAFKFQWSGDKIVPASLSVAVLRGGDTSFSVQLDASETQILRYQGGVFATLVPIVDDSRSKYIFDRDAIFSADDVIKADDIVIAKGVTIRVRGGHRLVLLFDKLSVDTEATIDGTGDQGATGVPGAKSALPDWPSQGEKDFRDAVISCRGGWDPSNDHHGKQGGTGGTGGPGATIILSSRPRTGRLAVVVDGGPGGEGGPGGAGRHMIRGDNPKYCCYTEVGGFGGETGCTAGPKGGTGAKGQDGPAPVYLDE